MAAHYSPLTTVDKAKLKLHPKQSKFIFKKPRNIQIIIGAIQKSIIC